MSSDDGEWQKVYDTTVSDHKPEWRNWQTRRIQNPLTFGSCGFESHLRYRLFISIQNPRCEYVVMRPLTDLIQLKAEIDQ